MSNNNYSEGGRPVDFDYSIDSSDSGLKGKNDQGSEKCDRRKRQLKREAIMWGGFFGILIAGTVWVTALNYYTNYLIRQDVEKPIQFQIKCRKNIEGSIIFVGLHWKKKFEEKNINFPCIKLGEKILRDSRPVALRISNNSLQAKFIVPADTPPNKYEGRIIFATDSALWQKAYENKNFRDEKVFIFNLNLSVKSFMEEWHLVIKWLYAAVFTWILLYVVCLKMYPAPAGTLQILYYHDHMEDEFHVKLGTSFASWIRPWSKSIVSVNGVIKKLNLPGTPELGLPEINLEFQFKNNITMLSYGDLSVCRRFKRLKSKFTMEKGKNLSGYEFLCETPKYYYVFWVSDKDYLTFSYSNL